MIVRRHVMGMDGSGGVAAFEGARGSVLLTGASGAIGLAAGPALVRAGYRVRGAVRSEAAAELMRQGGIEPVILDLFDVDTLTEAARGVDAIAHFATHIPQGYAATRRGAWRMNDRLRTEAVTNIVTAAQRLGVHRVVLESLALAYPDRGAAWLDESVLLDPPSPVMSSMLRAEELVEAFGVRGGEAVSLRLGRLYGPGRASSGLLAAVTARKMPIVGDGANYVSSVHVESSVWQRGHCPGAPSQLRHR